MRLLAESIRALDIATASLSPSVATSSRGFDPAAFRMADNITINVNAGVIGNEDTVELAVQKAILSIERKGDPLRYTGGLMTLPVINAVINFSTGPSFAQALILGEGQLDVNTLADSAAVIVDVSDQVDSIQTKRGRNPQADQFQTGTLNLRIVDLNSDFNPQNTSSPYFGLLDPMRKVQITATYSGITYPIFSGFITSYNTVRLKTLQR
jgi:hypothetical protein